MPADLRQASAFLLALSGKHDAAYTFQTFDDSPEKRRELARVLHGPLLSVAADLEALNARGAGIFITVNETDLHGRREENVTGLRALFVDVDDGEERTWALTPDILVRSVRGIHAYWRLAPDEPMEAFQPAQKQLARFYRTDEKVCDLPRVMRLPGFDHKKGEPVPVRLEFVGSGEPRTIASILEAHPVEAAQKPAPRPVAQEKPVSRRYALAALTSACDRVRAAAEGDRNNTLNREAFGPGQLVAGGSLSAAEATDKLLQAAVDSGLGESESRQTIESAFLGALSSPRSTAPDDPPRRVKLKGKVVGAEGPAVALALAPEPRPGVPAGWMEQLIWKADSRGNAVRLENCLANAMTILQEDPRFVDVFWLNEFAQEIVVRGRPPYEEATEQPHDPRPLRDDDYTRTASWLQREFRLLVGIEIVAQALQALAQRRTFHPVREYLTGLSWDGTPRLSSWLVDYCGAGGKDSPDDPAYLAAVSRAWMISAIARVMQPGTDCKADHVLILEGRQGIRKSTVFRVLSSPWFTDEIDALGSKDAGMQLQGAWIIELAELDALSRLEVSRTKAFLSKSFDRFRPPYGRTVIRFDRQCVFAGSVNHTEYLRDDSGNRRFWPVRCHDDRLDVEGLASTRDQLWAEALAAYRAKEPWWLPGALEDLAAVAQDDRASVDVWEDTVSEYLDEIDKDAGLYMRDRGSVTVSDVLKRLNVPVERQTQVEEKRVARILRHLGWEKQQVREVHGKRTKKYFKKALSPRAVTSGHDTKSHTEAQEASVTPFGQGDTVLRGDAQPLQTNRVPLSPPVTPCAVYAYMGKAGESVGTRGATGGQGDSPPEAGSRPAPGSFTCDDCGGHAYRLSVHSQTPVCTDCWGAA